MGWRARARARALSCVWGFLLSTVCLFAVRMVGGRGRERRGVSEEEISERARCPSWSLRDSLLECSATRK